MRQLSLNDTLTQDPSGKGPSPRTEYGGDTDHGKWHLPANLDKHPVEDGGSNKGKVNLDEADCRPRQLLAVVWSSEVPDESAMGKKRGNERNRVDGGHAAAVGLEMDIPLSGAGPNALDSPADSLPHYGNVKREEKPGANGCR